MAPIIIIEYKYRKLDLYHAIIIYTAFNLIISLEMQGLLTKRFPERSSCESRRASERWHPLIRGVMSDERSSSPS